MMGKEVKCSMSWSFVDENIEDVEYVNLKPEIQRLLGCSINENVFLEYPFAYVSAEAVKTYSKTFSSSFEKYKDKLELYKDSTFLIGYASKKLVSQDFFICLSEEARDRIVERNREITKRFRKCVSTQLEKCPRSWKSMGIEIDLESTFLKNARPYYEVEISLPICFLRQQRELSNRSSDDIRDGYVKIVPQFEIFENVEILRICKAVQTNLTSRENSVQTYPGNPKNQWIQYEYNCFLKEESSESRNDDEGNEIKERSKELIQEVMEVSETSEKGELKKTTSLDIFLKDHVEKIVDVIRYNTVINLHSDDISNLAQDVIQEPRLTNLITYKERVSLINLNCSKKRMITNISWHPHLNDVVAICYAEKKAVDVLVPRMKLQTESKFIDNFNCNDNDVVKDSDSDSKINNDFRINDNDSEDNNKSVEIESNPSEKYTKDEGNNTREINNIENGVRIWSLSDSFHPKMILANQNIIEVASFCPYKPDILIGGSYNGQITIWDLRGLLNFAEVSDVIPIIYPTAVSNKVTSHSSPVRSIHWLPSWYEVRTDGSLQKSSGESLQFATASLDGSLAIWDLRWQTYSTPPSKARKTGILESFDPKKLNGVLRPVYQVMIQLPKESWRFSPLSICLPLLKNENHLTRELDLRTIELLKRFLVATLEGEFISCSWDGQEFGTETASWEKCRFLSRSYIHDGPVLEISRCPFLDDVILTIGGRVFAIWKDDYLESSLFWRRGSCFFSSCCWSSRAGICLLARFDGELEVWEITRKTQKPIFSTFVSNGPITGLYPRFLSKIIGISDHNETLRILTEQEETKVESLEKIEWFEEFVWREVRRKRNFFLWEFGFLNSDSVAIERKEIRAVNEAAIRHQEARDKFLKEQEKLARQNAEKKIRMIMKSEANIRKYQDHERMKRVLLKKKGFVPSELEKSRLSLIVRQNERSSKLEKAKQEIYLKEKYFKDAVSAQFSSIEKKDESKVIVIPEVEKIQIRVTKYKEEFIKIRDEARRQLQENVYAPKFDWNTAMKDGKRRQMMMKVD